MSMLRDRIAHSGRTQTTSVYVPLSRTGSVYLEPGAVVDSGMPFPDKSYLYTGPYFPRVIPLTRLLINPGRVSYEDSTHLSDPQGLTIPPTAPEQWGHLYAAGRLYG